VPMVGLMLSFFAVELVETVRHCRRFGLRSPPTRNRMSRRPRACARRRAG
jgi:hypothetical protein